MKKMLLVLGAGGHGRVVKEVALSMVDSNGEPVYSRVDFLDDNAVDAVGNMGDLQRVASMYDAVFCGIGNCAVRRTMVQELLSAGYTVPVLVHSSAYVSPSAQVGAGSVVEPMAAINARATIGLGCIVSMGALVDHDAVLGNFCHVNTGSICMAGSAIEPLAKVGAGEKVAGFTAT